ncbi:MAG: hypothetical protein IPO99_15665 [Nitrospira sp.]|nr:hypothetical protein [Nitrospira sp.]
MFALTPLEQDHRLAERYLIVTCWAPATPTFAYEPTRLSPACLAEELRRPKGESDKSGMAKSPPWKCTTRVGVSFSALEFDIRAPLALLELMATQRASASWELLTPKYFGKSCHN